MNIINIMGVSGAGKDYCGEYLFQHFEKDPEKIPFKMKWSAKGKRVFEELYALDHLYMEDKKKRLEKPPGVDKTYLDLFISFYEWTRENDPYLFIRKKVKLIEDIAESTENAVIIFTDTRSEEEFKALHEYPCYNIYLTRDGEKCLKSDQWVHNAPRTHFDILDCYRNINDEGLKGLAEHLDYLF